MKRNHISLKTKLASALLALGHIPYDDAKLMSESQFLSLFEWDHGKLYAIEPDDSFWNLTPRLIAEHKTKSKTDTSIVAKSRRIEKQWREFTNTMAAKMDKRDCIYPDCLITGNWLGKACEHSCPYEQEKKKSAKKYKWPKRKFGRRK